MKKFFLLMLCIATIQSYGQFYQIGTTITELSPQLKGTDGFCPAPAIADDICDCPTGYVVVGYEGMTGNPYGPNAIGQFHLICKEFLIDGTLGITEVVTCTNGINNAGNAVLDGPVSTTGDNVIVGSQVNNGCGVAMVEGYEKPISEIIVGDANSNSSAMAILGSTVGGSPGDLQYADNGSVYIGMQTYIDNAPGGGVTPGNSAGVAWRFAPIEDAPPPIDDELILTNECSCEYNSAGVLSSFSDELFITGTAGDVWVLTSNSGVYTDVTLGALWATDGSVSFTVGATGNVNTGMFFHMDGAGYNLTFTLDENDDGIDEGDSTSESIGNNCNFEQYCAAEFDILDPCNCEYNLDASFAGFSEEIEITANAGDIWVLTGNLDGLGTVGSTGMFTDLAFTTPVATDGTYSVTIGAGGTGTTGIFYHQEMIGYTAEWTLDALGDGIGANDITVQSIDNTCTESNDCTGVPTASEWGLICLALSLLSLMLVYIKQSEATVIRA